MEDARTVMRQAQLYGSPDRVICHHYQSGENSFWSECQRPEIKLIELAKTAKSDQEDVPVASVSVLNFLDLKRNDPMCRKKDEENLYWSWRRRKKERKK